jgi:DNA polymerase-3 subunit gamma/tau
LDAAIKRPATNYDTPVAKPDLANEPMSLMPKSLRKETEADKPTGPAKLKRSSSGSLSGSISIIPTLKTKEEIKVEKEEVSYRPTAAFTPEKYSEVLKGFRTLLKEKGKDSLASIFDAVPVLKENTIHLLIENKALEDDFLANKSDFITYVRKELANYNIQVETEINKDTKLKKAYTPQEKFVKMSDNNPHLNELVKKLDMDVGYA